MKCINCGQVVEEGKFCEECKALAPSITEEDIEARFEELELAVE